MNADPFPAGAGPDHDAALIPEVTDEMMDHAAHRAAELADGVAHGTIVLGGAAPETTHLTEAPEAGESIVADPVVRREADVPAAHAEAVRPDPEGDAQAVTSSDEAVAAPPPDDIGERGPQVIEAAPSDAVDAFARYNDRLLAMARTNMAATGAHMLALLQARSLPEAASLNADHLRRQLDAITAQARELTGLARTLTREALQPLTGLIAPDR